MISFYTYDHEIAGMLLEDYRRLGYEVVLIPRMPLEQRLDLLLSHL